MEPNNLFNKLRSNLILDKSCFDYFGLLYLDPHELRSFNKKTRKKLDDILTINDYLVLSRNANYYSINNFKDTFSIDERLYELYCTIFDQKKEHEPNNFNKIMFSILENRINVGLRLYYSIFKHALENELLDLEELNLVKNRLKEDYRNLIRVMHGRSVNKLNKNLFKGKINGGFKIENRPIEMDHKYLLFSRARDLWLQKEELEKVCSPLLGGIQIPFMIEATYDFLNQEFGFNICKPETFHIIYGEHDNKKYGELLRSKELDYDEKLKRIIPKELHKSLEGENLVIFDDNTGTGETLRNLSKFFSPLYKQLDFGFIELSWKYLDDIKYEKRGGKSFDVNNIKYPTYRDYRHHTVLESLVKSIQDGNAKEYYIKLKKLGFQNGYIPDTECLFNRGLNYARKNNIKFSDPMVQQLAEESYKLETSDTNFILSLDIMNKKIRYLEKYNPFEIADLIMNFKTVNIIDIDKHQGKGYNEDLIKELCNMKECRVGGGIRNARDIRKLLALGTHKVIITTCANPELLSKFPRERIVVGIDSIDRRTGNINNVPEKIKRLGPYCCDIQYICVETDGKMQGGDLRRGIKYSKLTDKPYSICGGITYIHEIKELERKGIGAVVGRAIFENMFGDKI